MSMSHDLSVGPSLSTVVGYSVHTTYADVRDLTRSIRTSIDQLRRRKYTE